tara:strand:+ start:7967 stop:8305 length:339 start_codon:yes stop_codon:yes gene_type:complete
MDELLNKRSNEKGVPIKKTNTKTNNEVVNKIISNLNYYTFGYIGTLIAILYNTITERGVLGAIYDILKSSFFFIKKGQYYPNIILHKSFGFVSEPVERLFHSSTKNTSKPQQ